MYKLRGQKRYVKTIKLKWLTPLLVASPRTKDVERRPCLTNIHTYTSLSSSCYERLLPQISFCDPHPTVFFFCLPLDTNWLWGESSFCPEPLCTPPHGTFSHRHPISQLILKNIHTYTTRIAQRWSSILFTRFQQGLLAETGWWKEIFFPDSKLEKLFARTEIKVPHMDRSVSQSF